MYKHTLQSADDFKQALKLIRKYADGFTPSRGYDLRSIQSPGDLSPYRKKRIREYYESIRAITSQPHITKKPRTKKNLDIAWQASLNVPRLPAIKKVIIPVPKNTDAKIVYRGKGKNKRARIVTSDGIEKFKIDFKDYGVSFSDLDIEPVETLSALFETVGAKRYGIQAGEHDVKVGGVFQSFGTPDEAAQRISQLMNKYNNAENNNFYENWLFGMTAYNFGKQKDYMNYRADLIRDYKSRDKIRKELQSVSSNLKRAEREFAIRSKSVKGFIKRTEKRFILDAGTKKDMFNKEVGKLAATIKRLEQRKARIIEQLVLK